MAKETIPESVFDLEKLMREMATSLTSASAQLRQTFNTPEWKGSPFIYHIPRMTVSVRLGMSFSEGKVKGFFIFKSEKTTSQELASTIDLEFVSVPNNLGG